MIPRASIGDLNKSAAEYLPSVSSVRAPDIGFLVGLGRLNVTLFDALQFAPVRKHLSRQLRPVFSTGRLGLTMHVNELSREDYDPTCRHGALDINTQGAEIGVLPRTTIDFRLGPHLFFRRTTFKHRWQYTHQARLWPHSNLNICHNLSMSLIEDLRKPPPLAPQRVHHLDQQWALCWFNAAHSVPGA